MNWKKYIITRLPILCLFIGLVYIINNPPHQWLYIFGFTALGLLDFSIFLNKKSFTIQSPKKVISFSTLLCLLFVSFLALMRVTLFKTDIFDITSVAVQYSPRGFSYIISTIIGLFSFFSISLNISKNSVFGKNTKQYILCISAVIFAISTFAMPLFQTKVFIVYIAFLLILDWFLDRKKSSLVYNFAWILFMSALAGLFIYGLTIEKDKEDRHKIISSIYHTPTEENNSKILEFNKQIINSDILKTIADLPLQGKMDRKDFSSYIKRTTKIESEVICEAYAHTGEGFFTEQFTSYSEKVQPLSYAEKINKHVYFNPLSNDYLLHYQIVNKFYDEPIRLFITIKETTNKNNSIPVEYIVYKDGNEIASNIYNTMPMYSEELQKIKEDQLQGNFAYVVNHPVAGVNILSFRKIAGINRPLSLFSFIITISGIIFLLLVLLENYTSIYPEALSTNEQNRTSLKSKIQLMVISLIIFSFIIIGLVTTYHFQNILAKNKELQKEEELSTIVNHINLIVDSAEDNKTAIFTLENRLEEIENIYNKSFIILNEKKELIDSTQIRITTPTPKYEPLFAKESTPFGYLAITNKNSTFESSNVLDFLSTILNIFVFLFMTAGALAIFISNSITRPITKLGEKFREFKLGRSVEKLEWKTNDEIGELIDEYNKLTIKVQESAEIIAKTQRDSAWREMAKQVAHEIKNPLTPMKLSIQYLQHQMKMNPERGPELITKTAKTLEEQINNLTQIANEFSNFGAMPRTENEVVVLNDIVSAVHDLFRKREDIDIHLSEPIEDIVVFADHNHIVRILNNLVKNAIQAITDDRRGIINISLQAENGNAIIKVEDNGKGIPTEMKHKIFEPNFTTKSSGTGLGLAISANMIESFNGKLYFVSEENVGSIFYMEIPLMKLSPKDTTMN